MSAIKLMVLGAGKMGTALATYLTEFDHVASVTLVDAYESSLQRADDIIDSGKLQTLCVNLLEPEGRAALIEAMKSHRAGASALPNRLTSYQAAECAIEAGMDLVDILEEYHRRPDHHEIEDLRVPAGMSLEEYGESLHERAQAADVTFISGMGFAPGLSNITTGRGIAHLDECDVAIARVGGVPAPSLLGKYPLDYTVTWSFSHVLREYMVRVPVIKDGDIVEVDSLTERERFHFGALGKDHELECAITPGMPSFLHTRIGQVKEFSEKTVRWPGHYDGIELLKRCGLLDLKAVDVEGSTVVPRSLLHTVLTSKLAKQAGDHDACVMYCTAEGMKDGKRTLVEYHLWDEDPTDPFSSMARVTAYPAACATVILAEGIITERGVLAPEDCIDGAAYDRLIAMLAKKGIRIQETIRELTPA